MTTPALEQQVEIREDGTIADFPQIPDDRFAHCAGRIALLHINASSVFARLNERGQIATAVTATVTVIPPLGPTHKLAYGYYIDCPKVGTFIGAPIVCEVKTAESADDLMLRCDKRNPTPMPFVNDGPCRLPIGHDGECEWIPAGMPLSESFEIPEIVQPSGPPGPNGEPPTSALVDPTGRSLGSADYIATKKAFTIGSALRKDANLANFLESDGGHDH